jgi:hypothetical protein
MIQSYLVYGVPFIKKTREDWLPIYQLTEPGHYPNDLESFLSELDEDTFREDLNSYQYDNGTRQLGEDYILVSYLSEDIFFIVDKEYYQYIDPIGCYKIVQPSLNTYQKLVVFLNLNKISVDFTKIGMYILNSSIFTKSLDVSTKYTLD